VQDEPVDVATETGLDVLWRAHAARLWRAVFAYTHDPDVTNDVVAEAFAQCLARGGGVRDGRAWLWQAAFKIAAGEMRRRGGFVELDHEPSYSMPERAWGLVAALTALPDRQRAALVLHYYGDLRVREIAETLGCSAATVRVHLSQGRTRLRSLLEEDDA
jgi:RNA polymerase sigma-70 factor, ECF subfamily